MIQIILNEWKMLLRIRVLVYLTVFFTMGLILVSYLGIAQNNSQYEQQQAAQQHLREQ